MNHPLDMAVDDANNRVYVAEEFNNRISVFDKDGQYITAIQGGTGDFTEAFNRPNGVAVAPNSNLYVADTWNYSIREFTPQGSLVRSWGQAGQYGADAQTEPTDGFWGPRDVAVDGNGNVYVSDTGNKRIRVYDANGNYPARHRLGGERARCSLMSRAGWRLITRTACCTSPIPGISAYRSLTWTARRKFTFDVRGWYEDLGNRPYLAIDATRHLLYVTDPDAGRVLVYDLQGNCVGSFGQPTDTPTDNTQFTTVGGIATDADGNVYVDDATAGRVLRFAPFVDEIMPAPQVRWLERHSSAGCVNNGSGRHG